MRGGWVFVESSKQLGEFYLQYLNACIFSLQCTPSSIPGTILLLLGKLCLDWANSGTVGHLLSMADDFLLIGLPKCKLTHIDTLNVSERAYQAFPRTRRITVRAPGE